MCLKMMKISRRMKLTVYRPDCWICKHAIVENDVFVGCDNGKCKWEKRESKMMGPWIKGYPESEGWFLIEYICVHEGPHKGDLIYKAIKRYRDEITHVIWEDGGLGRSDEVWHPNRYMEIIK